MPQIIPSPALLRYPKFPAETTSDLTPEHALKRGISDITVRCADGVHLYLHRNNLETITRALDATEFLALSESKSHDIVIALPEHSNVLQIAFSFTYANRHPNLRGLDFETLLEIKGVVEKYQIFPAMDVCESRLKEAETLRILACA